MSACFSFVPPGIPVTGISLSGSTNGIITATLTPSNASGSIVWSVSDAENSSSSAIYIKSTTATTCTLAYKKGTYGNAFAQAYVTAKCDGVTAKISVVTINGSSCKYTSDV